MRIFLTAFLLLSFILICYKMQPTFASTQNMLLVTEVMPDPEGTDSLYEWIEITNLTTNSLNLNNFKLNNVVMPSFTIASNQIVILVKDSANFNIKYGDIYTTIQFNFSLPNAGSTIKLSDLTDNVLQTFTYPSATMEKSFELLNGDCSLIQKSTNNSLGDFNTPCVLPTSTAVISNTPTTTLTPTSVPVINDILITSLLPDPTSGPEWIELTNFGAFTESLTNYQITDAAKNKEVISLTLNSKEKKKINLSKVSLNNNGDIIQLRNSNGSIIDQFGYTNSLPDKVISTNQNSLITNEPTSSTPALNYCQEKEIQHDLKIPRIYIQSN